MSGEQEMLDDRYEQEMQRRMQLNLAADFLMSEGYLVIPPCEIGKYMGRYLIVSDSKANNIDENDIPF